MPITNKATLDVTVTAENPLYQGCELEEVAGRLRVKTRPFDAINLVGRNAESLVKNLMARGVEQLTLTGPTAIWVYLVVFHSAVHRFREVFYDDGKSTGGVRIAAH